uniref:Cathepsin L-like n=1 Tax=Parastrongyloides trichosuri TaxID=131310 RepID=A0A0N5A142_PARTI
MLTISGKKNNLTEENLNETEAQQYEIEWETYKNKFSKSFDNQTNEEMHKLEFFNTLNMVNHHNKLFRNGSTPYKLEINELSDYTYNDYQKLNGLRMEYSNNDLSSDASILLDLNNVTLNKSIDWREFDMVSPVQNQLQCGDCWIFAAVGAIEGAYKKKNGQLYNLSIQQIADCTVNNSCDGGWMTTAYAYAIKNKLETSEEYPYKGVEGTCKITNNNEIVNINSYKNIQPNNETYLELLVISVGPIAVGMDASQAAFQNYKSGVYDNKNCSTDINHAVLIVGLGSDVINGDYWIIKNSWGTNWGIDGYFLLRRGENACGIATAGSYPII